MNHGTGWSRRRAAPGCFSNGGYLATLNNQKAVPTGSRHTSRRPQRSLVNCRFVRRA